MLCSKRRFLQLLGLQIPALAGAVALHGMARAESRDVTVYCGLEQAISTPLNRLFEEQTGLSVSLVSGGTGDLMQRIRAEAQSPRCDVLLAVGADALEVDSAHLGPYASVHNPDLVPAFVTGKAWLPHGVLTQTFMVNTKLVPEGTEPVAWPDLADPKWRGRIAYVGADKSGAGCDRLQ